MPSTEISTGCVEHVVGKPFRPGQHLADQPDVVLDHASEEIHAGDLSVSEDEQRPRWMEVHLARRVDPEARRRSPPA